MPKATFFNLPAEKRDRIVELAIEEFAERPYAQASLSRIVARAGIAKGSIYQYFENKFDLYRWLLLDELSARKQAALAAEGNGEGNVFDRLERMYLTDVRFMLAQPRLARLSSWILDPSSDPEVHALHAELQRTGHASLRELLAEARDRGEIDTRVEPDLAAHLIGQALGPGLTNAVCARLGTDFPGLLHNPSLAEHIGDDDLRALVARAMDLLRFGLASQADAIDRAKRPAAEPEQRTETATEREGMERREGPTAEPEHRAEPERRAEPEHRPYERTEPERNEISVEAR